MLKVSALSFDYAAAPLLNEVSFAVEPGQLLHLRGKNGLGKTTLLKLLAGLLYPHSGQIFYNNQLIQDSLDAFQQNLCYVGHKPGLSALLTIRENYRFGHYGNDKRAYFQKYLSQFDLESIADRPCGQLSLGQRRRASLLRLMMTSAKLWLLDEPFSSLDKDAVGVLIENISGHLKEQGMVVMTSHQDLPKTHFDIHEYCL